MREDLLNEVFQDLQEQQSRNEETERLRRKKIREEFPEIGALMERREKMIRENVRGILQGKAAPEDLPARMEALSGKIRQALKASGFPEDYLAPVYACPLCRDTGYTGDRVREKCACVNRRYQEKLRRAIGLPEDGRETFEGYDENVFSPDKIEGTPYSQREVMNLIRNRCEEWAEAYPVQSPRDMVLSGASGLGKTFLLHAIASRLIRRGYPVLLLSAYKLLEIARKSYFDNDGGMEELIGAPILMIDDLGSEPLLQNVTIEQLFYLINERQRLNRTTVISTNLTQEDMRKRYTERIASRMTDLRSSLYLTLRGRDIRNGRA